MYFIINYNFSVENATLVLDKMKFFISVYTNSLFNYNNNNLLLLFTSNE